MKKYALLLIFGIYLTGCGESNRQEKELEITFDKVCVDGVQYLIRVGTPRNTHAGVMAPHFKPDGTLHLCKVKGE